ncbi:hypothetical protein [Psychroserpens sp.]|uniref:hypothetical protein n=1 Tax=Psychroserpens sp. TaxID=2020870 RepID=UPI003C75817C
MQCQQKSGVFLNLDCERDAAYTCSNCKKEICKRHHKQWESLLFCEDCYWEHYLLASEKKPTRLWDDLDDDMIIASTNIPSSQNSKNASSPEGFEDGFGGGEFSGGGAGASWTEGDMDSLTQSDGESGLFADGDDTFFYS